MTAPAATATKLVRRPVLLAATVTDNVATGLILPVLPFIALKLGVGAFAIGPRTRTRAASRSRACGVRRAGRGPGGGEGGP